MKRPTAFILLIIAILVIIGLILSKTIFTDENTSTPTSPRAHEIKAELSDVSIGKKQSVGSGKYVKYIEADLVIHNNSSKSIGLDPNGCDYRVYINNQQLGGHDACTEMGGVISLEPGNKYESKVYPYPPKADKGDTVYVEYGYILLLPENKGNGYSYDYRDNHYIKSNTTIIK